MCYVELSKRANVLMSHRCIFIKLDTLIPMNTGIGN